LKLIKKFLQESSLWDKLGKVGLMGLRLNRWRGKGDRFLGLQEFDRFFESLKCNFNSSTLQIFQSPIYLNEVETFQSFNFIFLCSSNLQICLLISPHFGSSTSALLRLDLKFSTLQPTISLDPLFLFQLLANFVGRIQIDVIAHL